MLLRLQQPGGFVRKTDQTLIPDNAAQSCFGVDFARGTLKGFKKASVLPDTYASPIRGSFVNSDTAGDERAFVASYDIDAVRSPVVQDDHRRFYWTGNNAGTTEFKFGLLGENTGSVVTQSYKVGVIKSPNYQVNSLEDLGVSIDTIKADPPFALSELTTNEMRLWLADENGGLIKDITDTDLVSFTALSPMASGWSNAYRIVVNKTLASYTTTTVPSTSTTYDNPSQLISFDGGASQAIATLYSVGGSVKYIKLFGKQSAYLADLIGTQVSVSQINVTKVNQLEVGEVSYSSLDIIGTFYVKSADSLSWNNSALPVELDPAAGDSAIPQGVTVAAVWDFTYNNQKYHVVFHTNPAYSGSVDIERGITGSVTSVDSVTWDLNLSFGLGSDYETRAYAVTWVNLLGEESELSLPIELTLQPGKEDARVVVDAPTLVAKIADLGISDGRYPLHGFRLYRSTGGEFFYVGTMVGTAEAHLDSESYLPTTSAGDILYFYDRVSGAALGDACQTEGFISDAAELQGLQGLKNVYNGILSAFKKNEVWLCEPYLPWAWKRKNVITLPHKIVDTLVTEEGLLVFTELETYFMAGQTPSDFVPRALAGEYPCLNKGAAIALENKAVYFSTEGPVIVQGMNQMIDQSVVTRDGWREMMAGWVGAGKGVFLTHFGNKIFATFGGETIDIGSGDLAGGIIIDVSTNNWTFYTEALPLYARHVPANFLNRIHDEVVFSQGAGTQWWILGDEHATEKAEWMWHSKEFLLPAPTNFGAMQLFGTGSVTVKVLADGVEKHTEVVTATRQGTIIRLPAGFIAESWSFRFEGTESELIKIHVANTIGELKGA